MSPWEVLEADDLDDPLRCSQIEIAAQVADLTARVEAIRAKVGGRAAHHDVQHHQPDSSHLDKLAAEVAHGKAKVEVKKDMRGDRRITREVDVMLFLLRSSAHGGQILVELARELPGEKRRTDIRLPGSKMDSNETFQQAAQKIIRDKLRVDDIPMTLDFKHIESFTEEQESTTYSGVYTTYHINIVSGYLTTTDEEVLGHLGLLKEGSIFTRGDKTQGTTYYTWMNTKQAQNMKVRMSAAQPGHTARPKRHHKVVTVAHALAELTKKVDILYNKNKGLQQLEASLPAAQAFMQLEVSNAASFARVSAAKRDYVVAHGDNLRGFAQSLAEVSRLEPFLNPPGLADVPMLAPTLQRLESGSALLCDASSRLHARVGKIAQDYHKTINAMNSQFLVWDRLLDQKLGDAT
eukprot:TRINITY_DN11157_c0_g1_i1.p1 TRINITY_DN11157_c0_g1~~TRINITY_DN11157_c0_g1_i1.p1  ORF type:complete len:407 (-),score=94.00 TRINITY_DN11157_c0_g1_i1:110-1330(-)